MKKPIKLYLQYPWKFPDSPYYKYLIQELPEGIEYLNGGKQKGVITNKNFFWFSNFLKKIIRAFIRKVFPSMINAHLSPKGNYDLIHCAHCLSKNKDKPWITDIEAFWQFWVATIETKRGINKVKKVLMRENCKKILPWTEKTRKDLLRIFPELENKIEVVFPAIPERKDLVKKPSDRINLIFAGRYFFQKGGLHILEVMDKLTKKYPRVHGIFISSTPKDIYKKYSKNKKISFYDLIPQEKLFELFNKSHIFIYPGYSDSVGFGFLEAMSFGLPAITVDGWSRREIIKEGKTGFVLERPKEFNWDKIGNIESKIIDKIITKTSYLIENKNLLKKISQNCINEIKAGKFSIKERNKRLKRIYQEALK